MSALKDLKTVSTMLYKQSEVVHPQWLPNNYSTAS